MYRKDLPQLSNAKSAVQSKDAIARETNRYGELLSPYTHRALDYAALNGHVRTVKFLVENGYHGTDALQYLDGKKQLTPRQVEIYEYLNGRLKIWKQVF